MSGYQPIKTKAERRAERVENFVKAVDDVIDRADAHLNHRLSLKTIAKEVVAGFTDKIIPQGADELGNMLFSGSAYLPWPGPGNLQPIPAPANDNYPLVELLQQPSSVEAGGEPQLDG